LTKNYEYEEILCNHTTHLEANANDNSIELQWSNAADNIRGYHVFRNNERITNELLTNKTYIDVDLPFGNYEYYVRTYYDEGCVSDSSNHVVVWIGEETCEPVTDLVSEKINYNSILLTWSEPEDYLPVDGYFVYRNEQLQTATPIITNDYIDKNLPVGEYEYYVITKYTNDCVSDSSNHVKETVGVGIVETHCNASLRVYPNPTSNQLKIKNYELKITGIQIFDVFGHVVATVETRHATSLQTTHEPTIDISHFPKGVYFLQIQTENDVITKKIIKY
jgi:hypothetical protein